MDYVRVFEGFVVESFSTELDMKDLFPQELVWVCVDNINPKPAEGWVATELTKGWSFTDPAQVPLSDAEKVESILKERNHLMTEANTATFGMVDAYIVGSLSDQDKVIFEKYAKYKLALSKIPSQEGFPNFVDWPILEQE